MRETQLVAKVVAGRWHALRGEARGTFLRGYLNRQTVVETTDDSYQTDKLGLWTKAGSVTCFDVIETQAPRGSKEHTA